MKNIFILLEQNISVTFEELDFKACSGTIYSTLLLAKELSSTGRYNIYIGHNGPNYISGGVRFINNKNYESLNESLSKFRVDILIVSGSSELVFEYINYKLEKKIFWLHNHIPLKNVKRMVDSGMISDIVTVSSYQLGRMFTLGLTKNIRYIYNPYQLPKNDALFDKETFTTVDEKFDIKLCFIGALVPQKGIENLFWIYHKLVSKGIKVKLDIYGSSNLYNGEKLEGITKVLSPDMEEKYKDILFDKLGNVKEGVIFHGAVGKEYILSNCARSDIFLSGLNEFGAAECFPISFLDAQAVGVPVYTLNRGGQKEAVLSSSSGKVFRNLDLLLLELERFSKIGDITKPDTSTCFSSVSPVLISKEWENVFNGGEFPFSKKIGAVSSFLSVIFSMLGNGLIMRKKRRCS